MTKTMARSLQVAAVVLAIAGAISLIAYAIYFYQPELAQAKLAAEARGTKEAADILASERVAYYTEVLAVFTGALSAFGVLQLFFLVRADRAADTNSRAALASARAAEESLKAANRPWLLLEAIDIRTLRFTESGSLVAEVRPAIHNIGRYPATNVRIEYALVDLPRQPDEELRELRVRMATVHRGFPGEVVFPGVRPTRAWNSVTLDALSAPDNGFGTGAVQLFLVGCISYEFALSDSVHQTPFSARVYSVPMGPIRIGLTLGEGQVMLDTERMISAHRPD